MFTIYRNSKEPPYSLSAHYFFHLVLSCTGIISSRHIFLPARFCFIWESQTWLCCPILKLLFPPFPHFRFLGCSFVTSAVRRGAGQEVESWRWKSNVDLCTQCYCWCFYLPPCCFPFTVSALINEYHFPSVTELYTSKNAKHLYWIVSIFTSNNCKVLHVFCLPLMCLGDEMSARCEK